jgi:hypothetical protein
MKNGWKPLKLIEAILILNIIIIFIINYLLFLPVWRHQADMLPTSKALEQITPFK